MRASSLAADAEVVALLAEPPTELWLVRLDGSFLGQAPLPFAPDAQCAVSFSPDGRELLVLDPGGVLHRFELRWR